MKSKVILHIDMNSYFASVEQQANVFLRGRPVGVCAYLSSNGCIIASSVEAKQQGVKTGCRVKDGLGLCPELVLVQNDPPKYRTVTKKIFQILAEYTTDLETYSIDEAFLDVTALVKTYQSYSSSRAEQGRVERSSNIPKYDEAPRQARGDKKWSDLDVAKKIGEEVNQRIKQETGEWLKSSIGISRTRFLAKLVSDTGPKDTVSILDVVQVPEYIENLELTDIWGINWRMEKRFNSLGIKTPLDLYQADPYRLLRTLHKPGYYLWAGLRGLSIEQTKTLKTPKSVGHSYCLANKSTDKQYLARVLMKLCEKTGRRLRELEVDAQAVTVYWSYVSLRGGGKSRKLYAPIFDSWDIFRHAWQPLQDLNLPDKIRMLAVSVSSFIPISNQLDLFENSFFEDKNCSKKTGTDSTRSHNNCTWNFNVSFKPQRKKRALVKALDKINNKYGEFTLIRGSMWGTDQSAPDRIGFKKTVSWEN